MVPKNAAQPEKPMMRKVAISAARAATEEYMVLSAPASAPIAIMMPSTQAMTMNAPRRLRGLPRIIVALAEDFQAVAGAASPRPNALNAVHRRRQR